LGNYAKRTTQRGARRVAFIAGFALIAAYGWVALEGPQGVQALLAKHREIRQLQEQNILLSRQNEERRARIQRLKDSPSEQEMEIRKQLKLQKQGETTFILPDQPKEPQKTPDQE
jgi:cell division protein FtsB